MTLLLAIYWTFPYCIICIRWSFTQGGEASTRSNSVRDCQHGYGSVILSKEATSNTLCEPQLESVSCGEVSNMMKTAVCLNGESSLLSHNSLKMDKANSFAGRCVLDVDVEKGRPELEKSESIYESVVNLKHDDSLARELLNEFILRIRGKLVHPLMNHRPECVYDAPTNRSRKYKRSAFDSRRVLLLFSSLSIVGTMTLIYLTLRVRQIGDVSGTGNI